MQRLVVIGAGHAAGAMVALLRRYDFQGAITLVGEEPLPPYQRPPLSKAWLKGEVEADGLALRPVAFYAQNAIVFRPGMQAVGLDRSARIVRLAGGETLPYDRLVIATGARPMMLEIPGSDLDGVMVLRTAADAEALKARLAPGHRLAVVGGGYIGLEVAASARALGAEVVVLEREGRLLSRVASPEVSRFFAERHRAEGVVADVGCNVVGFAGVAGRVAGVRLADGRAVRCDVALVGVGAQPNEELAVAAGLTCERGIIVDLEARTSDPDIHAIGDVTRRPMPFHNCLFRPESVPSALEQGKQAASALTGRPPPAPEVPWNWSDQYDVKLQIAGLVQPADEVIVRGDPRVAAFAVYRLVGGRVRSVEAVNSPPDFMAGKQLIAAGTCVDPRRLSDFSVRIRDLVAG